MSALPATPAALAASAGRRRHLGTDCRPRRHALPTSTARTPSARRYRQLDAAFGDTPHAIHYALKANSSLAIVRLVRALGSARRRQLAWARWTSRCAAASPRPRLSSPGVGKSAGELERAVALDLLAINVESPGELERLDPPGRRPRRAWPGWPCASTPTSTPRATRTSPPASSRTSSACRSTWRRRCSATSPRARSLKAVGIHVHIGSQITTLDPLAGRPKRWCALAAELRDDGIALEHLDFGGGLGIAYDGGAGARPDGLRARASSRAARGSD